MRQRELAKVAELEAAGRKVPLSTLQRLRLGYERQGLWGLVDGRAVQRASVTGRVDPPWSRLPGRLSRRRPTVRPAR